MKISLKNKLILTIILAAVAVAALMGYLSFYLLHFDFEQRVFSQLQSVMVLKTSSIDNFVDDSKKEIEYLVSNSLLSNWLIGYFEDGKKNKEDIVDFYNEVMASEDLFSDLFVMDDQGVVILSTNSVDEGKVRQSESYFVNSKKETYLRDFYYDTSINAPVIVVGTPIKNKEGKFLGVLAGRLRLEMINGVIRESSGLGKTAESFLVNKNNLLVTELTKEAGVSLKKTIFTPQVNKCITGENVIGKAIDYHGDEVYGSYRWIPAIGSCLATKVDTQEVFALIVKFYYILAGVTVVVIVIVGVVAYYLGKRILGPLQVLQEAVQGVNDENLDIQVSVDSNDEISELARAFEGMAKKLKASYVGLEDKVKEKTLALETKLEELEKMNELMVDRELKMIELKKSLEEIKNRGTL